MLLPQRSSPLPAALAAQPAAPTPPAEAGELEEIIVEAPRRLAPPVPPSAHHTPRLTPNHFRGESELIAKVRVGVFYNDLRLADARDAARLITRIAATATQACDYLDALYPLQQDPDCRARAERDARPAADAAIAAAQALAAAAPAPVAAH